MRTKTNILYKAKTFCFSFKQEYLIRKFTFSEKYFAKSQDFANFFCLNKISNHPEVVCEA